jgi:hypothetical protein
MENLDKALAEITTKIAGLTDKYGPDAIALAGKVLQYKAAAGLIWPVVAIVGFIVAARTFVYGFKVLNTSDEPEPVLVGRLFVSGIVGIFMGIAATVGLFDFLLDPLRWASAFDPQVAIAANVLSALK